ncbi:ABC transporter substrate-binding protein [Rhodococcoides trifolii]|uniref:ABC transporter substrate-binding protein n=1 Tax=Rhodococcoides trifolii TaxID=908250 RepID=A0A917LE21_9NOCA|nr:iron-siderophore ABC transporter substrate-binding protein [Rhodococcus trifolii]GGG14845.1 ABC transporter substrate-binding protein [Rhodococcus trifolii]
MRSVFLRPAIGAVALILTAAALGGCSSTDDAADVDATGVDATATATSASDQFPVTIGGLFGDVTVDTQPERVVALGWGDAETALALGVQPIGASDWLDFGGNGVGPWADSLYQSPPKLIATNEPSIEEVAALEPDLILDTRASGDRSRYDALSGLGVPVVSVPSDGANYVTTWQQQLDIVGKALGLSDKAADLKSQLQSQFDAVRSDNPQFTGKTVAVGAKFGGTYGAYVTGDGRVDLMTALGFVNKPELDALATGSFYVPISNEQVVAFDADLTVMFPIGAPASSITEDPVYAAVPSVRAGHDVVFDDTTLANAFSSGTTLGLSYALDTAVPRFAEALAR